MTEKEIELSQSQKKIAEVCDKIKEILIYKNQNYGNSALNPEPIFYKGSAQDSILIRLNDKISRIKNNKDKPRINDISDLIGYCVLLLVSMGATAEDFDKLKD